MSEAGKPDKKKKDDFDQEEYRLRKRLPKRLPKRKTDVYVSKKTNFKGQLARCQKLLDSGHHEIYIHGLGAAIHRAINLALQLEAQGNGSVQVWTNTSTEELVDDLEPDNESLEPESQTRNNSAIHIKVFRPNILQSDNSKSELSDVSKMQVSS